MKSPFKNIYVQLGAGLIIVVALTWGAISILSHHAAAYSSATVSRQDLTEIVTATGNVTPNQSVTLAFNMQGKVAAVNADVGSTTHAGEVLAALDSGTLEASLAGAEADVQAAEAKLAELQRGARPEDLALYEQKYSDASAALLVAMKDAYLQTENAITGKADTVFSSGNSANPTINIRTQSQNEAFSIDQERISVGDKLDAWKTALAALGSAVTDAGTLGQARATTADALSAVKSYLDALGTIANDLTVGNSGMTQSAIDADTAIVNAAAQQVTGAATAYQTADAAWSAARDSLALEKAGSTAEDIQAGQAAVAKAQAIVAGLESQLRQSYIISPFDGVVTSMNVKVGEIYVPGISAAEGVSLIGNGAYKIEAYVPETDIGKIQTGDAVSVTFDAYGSEEVFPAHVTLVDPAETSQNGINAYKVTIGFDSQSDPRIKSGLTANATITTKTVAGALAVPTRDIVRHGASTFVLVKQPGSSAYAEQPVKTGITSGDGFTEIISGLNEGQEIAGFGSAQ